MTSREIQFAFTRLQTYVARAQLAARMGNTAQAMADVAEIHYIADQLWLALEKVNQEKEYHDQV